jgi:hypothetical protein
MAATELAPFSWGVISLSQATYINGIPCATRQAIGEWLEYADPQKGIDNILAKNAHIERHSVALNLRATDGKNYETKVYHPIGFMLIVMESDQPKAKAMKEAVAEFVWRFAGPQEMTRKERLELLKHRRLLLTDLAKTGDIALREALVTDLREVSLTLGVPVPAALRIQQLPLGGV